MLLCFVLYPIPIFFLFLKMAMACLLPSAICALSSLSTRPSPRRTPPALLSLPSPHSHSLLSPSPDLIVVGGGPAGVFSAIAAARAGCDVLVIEASAHLLAKVRVSGGGRCNVMHDHTSWDPRGGRELLQLRYPRGATQLTGALTKRFSPAETAAWFEAEGVELKCEADGRVFPSTDDSSTIIDALLSAAKRAGVQFQLRSKVLRIERSPESCGARASWLGFRVSTRTARGAESSVLSCRALILATGSSSHHLASSLGHEIAPLVPSLFSFRLRAGSTLDASLAGVSVQDAQLTLLPSPGQSPVATESKGRGGGIPAGRKAHRRKADLSARGPLLITHRGLSGPAALKLSAFAAVELGVRRKAKSQSADHHRKIHKKSGSRHKNRH